MILAQPLQFYNLYKLSMGTVLIDNFVILGLHMNCGLWGSNARRSWGIDASVVITTVLVADFVT